MSALTSIDAASHAAAPPCRDLGRWNALARSTFGAIDVRARPEGFSARMARREVAELRLVNVQSTAASVRGVAAQRDGWYLLYNRQGACTVRQSGRSTVIEDGEMSLLRADASYEIDFSQPNRMWVVHLPAVAGHASLDEHVAQRHRREDAIVIGTLLERLQSVDADTAAQMDPAALRRAVVDLLRLAPPQARFGNRTVPATRRQWLLARLQAEVARQLEDPELDAAALGRSLGVSGRTVQVVFAGQGTTLGAYLLEQRLACAARALRDPSGARDSISTVALRSGFGDLSHFCRVFRRRYGCSASAWRRGC